MKRSLLLPMLLVALSACNREITGLGPPSDPATETFASSLGVDIAQMSRTERGTYYQDIVVGPSDAPEVTEATTLVKVTYAGYLKDGTLFDSGTGAEFDPAALIVGFRDGLIGMREGGKRKLVIPSDLGYGGHSLRNSDNTIKIPRQSTLIFDVQLITVTNPSSTTT